MTRLANQSSIRFPDTAMLPWAISTTVGHLQELWPVVALVPVALAGFAILGLAMVVFAAADPTPAVLAGVCARLLAAVFTRFAPDAEKECAG